MSFWTGAKFPGGAKDTVKLLKFSVEYGLERVLAVKDALPAASSHYWLGAKRTRTPCSFKIDTTKDIPVSAIDLSSYDRKYLVVAQ